MAAQDSKDLSAVLQPWCMKYKDLHQHQATKCKDGRLHPNHVTNVKVNNGLLDATSNQKNVRLVASRYLGVCIYIDNIVTGKTNEEHLRNLDEVLSQLEKAGTRLKKKCARNRVSQQL